MQAEQSSRSRVEEQFETGLRHPNQVTDEQFWDFWCLWVERDVESARLHRPCMFALLLWSLRLWTLFIVERFRLLFNPDDLNRSFLPETKQWMVHGIDL